MNICEIDLKHFGKFTDQKMRFHSGVNVIYGENETGKSTMHAFLKAMFFGLERGRGRIAKNDEYTLRCPWDNSGYFAGSVKFEQNGKRYILYRSFAKNGKEASLYCETDGQEYPVERGVLEALGIQMDEDTFCNTLFLGKQTGQTEEGLGTAIRNFCVNADTGGNGEIDLKQAKDTLQKEKKALEAEKKKHMANRIEKLQEIRMRIDYTRQELKELYDEERDCKEKLSQLERKGKEREMAGYAELEDAVYQEGVKGTVWKVGKILMALVAVAAMVFALMAEQWQNRAIACAVILFACLVVTFFGKRDQEFKTRKKEWEQYQREQQMQKLLKSQERLLHEQKREAPIRQKLQTNLEWLQNTQREKEGVLEELEEQQRKLQDADAKQLELEGKLAGIYLAIDTMNEVAAEMYQEFSGKLNRRVSEILALITNGRYQKIFLDEELQVRIQAEDRLVGIEQVSRGTMEQIYFALRMAAAEMIDDEETMPIFLDDAFLTYDDVRLEATLRWLCACKRQVILFTCHRREQEILEKIYEGIS